MLLRPESRALFLRLAVHSDVAGAVCASVAEGAFSDATEVRKICTIAGVAMARAAEVEEFLQVASSAQLFQRTSQRTWRPLAPQQHRELAPLFVGASLYRSEVHSDRDTVQVVVTKPPAPSKFTSQLLESAGDWGMADTKETLPGIAESARSRFCVMTPYIDDIGASILLNLFARVRHGVERILISRAETGDRAPASLRKVASEFAALNVRALSFRVGREDAFGNETSHAKVVLADDHTAYVGSLNMNRWSFEYSLEVGVCVRGHSAALVAEIVNAAERVSVPMQ